MLARMDIQAPQVRKVGEVTTAATVPMDFLDLLVTLAFLDQMATPVRPVRMATSAIPA